MKRIGRKRLLAVAGGAVLALGAVGWWVVRPWVVTHQFRRTLEEALGTRVEIHDVDYAFGSTATIRGLRIYDSNGDLLARVNRIEAQFESSPLSRPDRVRRIDARGILVRPTCDERGAWNFESLRRGGEPIWIGEVRLRTLTVEVARRGVDLVLRGGVEEATVVPGRATLKSLILECSEGSAAEPILQAPTATVGFTGEIASVQSLDEVSVDRPQGWTGLTADGKPVLQQRLRKMFGDANAAAPDRAWVRRVRVRDGRIHASFQTPEGPPWTLPIDAVQARIDWEDPPALKVEQLEAKICGGEFICNEGLLRVDGAGPSRLHLTMTNLDVERLAATTRLSSRRLRGTLNAIVRADEISPAGEILGAGQAWATDAEIWEMPVFAGLARELGLNLSPGSKFKMIEAKFVISRDRFVFKDLATQGGDAVNVVGEGQMKLDGTGLTVHLRPRLVSTRDVPVVGAPTQALTDLIGGTAVTVVVSGTIVDPKTTVVHGKTVTDPIQDFFGLFK
jgi:hypothetical protein